MPTPSISAPMNIRPLQPGLTPPRRRLGLVLLASLLLAACGNPSSRDEGQVQQEADWIAAQEQAAQEQRQQQRTAALERERQTRAQQAEQRRQARTDIEQRQAQASQRADAERQARARETALTREQAEERQQRERREQAAIAAEAEIQAKLARIAELEEQIAAISANTAATDADNQLLREAIAAAEALLMALNVEQAKYENIVDGETVVPLDKEGIETLRERKNEATDRLDEID